MVGARAARTDFNQWITALVRWGDMDAFGHVNNAKYFTYCESARIAYFEALGIELDRSVIRHAPAVVTATCNFLRQVHHPATLEVGARTTQLGRSSFTLEYGIFLEGTDELVADGSSVVVWVDYEAEKSAPLPEDLKRGIQRIEGRDFA
ncbi:MAG: thioesterase family protein [Acidobacteriota bacterium]